jgi:glycosyltransferase involved in cell wall biosynthesis
VKILFVIPSLDYVGAAKQLSLLVPALPRDRFELRVCVVSAAGPFGEPIRKAGVPVDALGWRRWVELGALRGLRRLLREFRPDVVHAWQPATLRLLGPLSGWRVGRLVVSSPLPPRGRPAALDRWLLRRAGRVVVGSQAEAERCRRLGVIAERLAQVQPAVAAPLPSPPRTLAGISASARVLVCVGPLAPHKGFMDAIWTFDILRYVEESLQLVLVGDGPDRVRLEDFSRVTQTRSFLVGRQPDAACYLARADVVWVPSRAAGGVNVALEAMALGRPVIATRLLSEIIADGENGYLVDPGDKVSLARRTRQLLKDPELSRRLGEAGRRRVAERFNVPAMVARFCTIYDGVCLPFARIAPE